METYQWNTPTLRLPSTRPKLVARLPQTMEFLREGNEVWHYNLAKPLEKRWEYYYSVLPE